MTYKLNGKYVSEKDIPENAKHVRTIHEEHYETEDYTKQQSINAHNYFQKMREDWEELEKRHG